jgi:hypothetical protein
MATPFVEGRLLDKDLSCEIETGCAISGRPIVFELDSELRYRVRPPAEKPIFLHSQARPAQPRGAVHRR